MVKPEAEEPLVVAPALFGLGGILEADAAVDGIGCVRLRALRVLGLIRGSVSL